MVRKQVVCPHCGVDVAISVEPSNYHWKETHALRKAFAELQAFECERDYQCYACGEIFYATLMKGSEPDLPYPHNRMLADPKLD